MNPGTVKDWVQILVGMIAIMTIVVTVAVTLKAKAIKAIAVQVADIQKEFKINGGLTTRDEIKRIGTAVERLVGGQHFMMSRSGEAIWQCDAAGACRWASPDLCLLMGLDNSQMMGSGWLSAIETQAERARVLNSWCNSIANRIPYSEQYMIWNRNKGERSLVESRGFTTSDSEGNPVWHYGTVNRIHRFDTRETEVDTAIPGMKG